MTTLRRLQEDDLFRFNNVNLDYLTETYHQGFYLEYLSTWPEYFLFQEAPDGRLMGYVMGKVEGEGERWHGHVTAVTVAPEFRRLGLAKTLMANLEEISEKTHNAYFVDLFVRSSNALAIAMYEKMGYIKHSRVIDYYSGSANTEPEDAFDMHKALTRDTKRKSMIPLNHDLQADEVPD